MENRAVTFLVEDNDGDDETVNRQYQSSFLIDRDCTYDELLMEFADFIRGLGYVIPHDKVLKFVDESYYEPNKDPLIWNKIVNSLNQ